MEVLMPKLTRKNLPLLESGQPDFVALLMISML
jgi:hypothetical protein